MEQPFLVSVLPGQTNHPLWPDIEALLKPAAEYGGVKPFEDGDLVWIAFRGPEIFGVCVTEGNAVKAIAGSRMKDWLPQLDEAVSDWARSNGMERLVALGRKGWLRHFQKYGWALRGDEDGRLLFEKELLDGR